jgi:hypothetical protein
MKKSMTPTISRRRFVRSAGFVSAATLFGLRRSAGAAASLELLDTRVISRQPQFYHGWPTLARRHNGQLLLAYSGGREQHICPFGRVEWMVSSNQGKTWNWPQVLLNSAIDDRDSGVLETDKGTILVTTFTSLAYEPILAKAQQIKPGTPGAWPTERLASWKAAQDRLTAEQRRASLGQWLMRSTDSGMNWSSPIDTIVNSPHGPITLADGRLLYAGKELWTKAHRVGVCESKDDGLTWRWLAEIKPRPGDDIKEYHELHAVETGDGRILVHIRNHNKANDGETLQAESSDGGVTWSQPHAIGVWGMPSFLLKLKDGRLLMSYGHRRAPLGNQARLSEDQGRTWSPAMMISNDGASTDLGYPSTVELDDGSFLTAWYESMKESPRAVLRQARWRLRS